MHLVSVDVVQAVEQHLHDLLDLRQGELDIRIAQETGQVVLTEVKHQVDAALVAIVQCGFKAVRGRSNEQPTCTSFIWWHVYLLDQPLVLQISIRLTTFSCLSSCRILISLRAVMGN